MKRAVLCSAALMMLMVPLLALLVPTATADITAPESWLNMQISSDHKLTPSGSEVFERHVENASRMGLLDLGIIPFQTIEWRTVGLWESDPVTNDLLIVDDVVISLVMRDKNQTTATIRVLMQIDDNTIGLETQENVQLSATNQVFLFTPRTGDNTIPQGGILQFKLEVQCVSESCVFVGGGDLGTRLQFLAAPIRIDNLAYYEGRVSVEVEEAWLVDPTSLDFDMTVDQLNPVTLTDMHGSGADLVVHFDMVLTPGEYKLYWQIMYAGGSYFSGYTTFIVPQPGSGGGGGGGGTNPPPVTLMSFSQCARTYYDASGDDISYRTNWMGGQPIKEVNVGVVPNIDITRINVTRRAEMLQITVGFSASTPEWMSLYVYFVSQTFSQPAMDLDDNFARFPSVYEPPHTVATNRYGSSWAHWSNSYYNREPGSNNIIIMGGLAALQNLGLEPGFGVFIVAMEEERGYGEQNATEFTNLDYAGMGAWEVPPENPDAVYVPSMGSLLPFIAAGLIGLIIMSVLIMVLLRVRKKRLEGISNVYTVETIDDDDDDEHMEWDEEETGIKKVRAIPIDQYKK